MATINSLVNNVCHSSVSRAIDSHFSSIPVFLDVGVSDTYKVSYIKVADDWKQIKQVFNSSGSASTVYSVIDTPPTFPPCDPTEPYFDGMQMGWGIVAAMVAVTGVILIRRAFFQ